MVLIHPGEFDMGSPVRENSFVDNERLHRVRITKPFYMGRHEVTQAVWTRVMGENPSKFKDMLAPVESVTYVDCQEFIARLNTLVPGGGFRLPTEAEWEYACRAETTTRFSFGDDDARLKEYAWYDGNSGGRTHPVGQRAPNPWGLYDMHGNMLEWCADWNGDDYYDNSPHDDPTGPTRGRARICRGGCWLSDSGGCTSSWRDRQDPGERDDFTGFRVVREVR
jgi:formylglycine-generating enzyme required for sulfatase activity